MLQNWLKPLSAAQAKSIENLPAGAFGQKVLLHRTEFPDLKKVKVALIGISEKDANEIRDALYRTSWHFPEGTVADLGNLRKSDHSFLIPMLYELLSGKVLPVLLGGANQDARAQFLAYQDAKALVNLVMIDERCPFAPEEPYHGIISPRHPLLFHMGLVGYQAHQMPLATLQHLQKTHADLLRLGRTRNAMEECEPIIRDADLMAFHLNALKQSEAPGVKNASPSGFFVEEACQLCRYAGLSDKLTSFGIYGYDRDRDRDRQTTQTIAQMVWYFLEGYFNRKNDYPASTAGLTEYVVDFRHLNYQLTFWKSVKTGRWWMQVPVATKKKHERHRLVPCSYQDYQSACREELPDRLMQALSRFG